MSVSRLLRSRAPRHPPSARLLCFPYAGVGGSVYRLWSKGPPASPDSPFMAQLTRRYRGIPAEILE
jgi:surfactin synthase thioesterase subunit